MRYFLVFGGEPDCSTEMGRLLGSLQSILKDRNHCLQFADADGGMTPQQQSKLLSRIELAKGVLLISAVTADGLFTMPKGLDELPAGALAGKPILLFVAGGRLGNVAVIERDLRPTLLRLATNAIAARVHLKKTKDAGKPLSRESRKEAAEAFDFILRVTQQRQTEAGSLITLG